MNTDETRIFRQIRLLLEKLFRAISTRDGTIQPAITTESGPAVRWFRLWPWLVVLLVLLFVGFIRVRLLDMPLERDEGEYAYAGQLILQGIPPYELAYNMKLPGTYFAYALGMAVFGQTAARGASDAAGGEQPDDRFCFFAGTETFWGDGGFGGVCELWDHVGQPGGDGHGGARESFCRVVRGAGDAAFVEGG